MGRVRLRGGNGEGEGGNGKGEMGRGQRGGGKEGARGDFTDGYDEMSGWIYGMFGWNEAKCFSDFVHPCNAVIVYLFICLFIYLFGYRRPNRKA